MIILHICALGGPHLLPHFSQLIHHPLHFFLVFRGQRTMVSQLIHIAHHFIHGVLIGMVIGTHHVLAGLAVHDLAIYFGLCIYRKKQHQHQEYKISRRFHNKLPTKYLINFLDIVLCPDSRRIKPRSQSDLERVERILSLVLGIGASHILNRIECHRVGDAFEMCLEGAGH